MSDEDTSKMVIICNHTEPKYIMPTMLLGASGVGLGDKVFLFFVPGGAPALVKGELEKIRDMKLKGLPDPVELFDTILAEGGKVIMCELALENKDIKREDIREGVDIMSAPSFLLDADGAGMTFTF
jgi:predicted peroxiredoxin